MLLKSLNFLKMLSVICILSYCKLPQAEQDDKSKAVEPSKKAEQQDQEVAFKIAADAQVAPPFSPFTNSELDLYNMTQGELQRVPPADLIREIEKLEARNNAEKVELYELQKFNAILCQRLAILKRQCVAQLYITNDHGLDGVNCTGNDKEPEPEAEIRVQIQGGQDKSYILLADSLYVTNEITAGSPSPVEFQRKDNKLVKPPRFRDLESLNIIAVKPGTAQIIDGRLAMQKDQMPPIEQISIKISVNGQPLLSDYTLAKPDDPHDDWYYRLNPNGILTLGRSDACQVTLKELKELQEQSKG
ncbi:MAG: hypothetical protein HRU09_09905 [Oligoflexales bacterium]|nr:hypothetical protein [Oligoflexales bacterium]